MFASFLGNFRKYKEFEGKYRNEVKILGNIQFRPRIALRTACRVSDAWREKMGNIRNFRNTRHPAHPLQALLCIRC